MVACATSCTIHVAAATEDTSHKDSTGMWAENSVTGMSWDGSADALVAVPGTGKSGFIDLMKLVGQEVTISLKQIYRKISGEASAELLSGKAIINDISLTAGNKQNATYSVQFTGNGELSRNLGSLKEDESTQQAPGITM